MLRGGLSKVLPAYLAEYYGEPVRERRNVAVPASVSLFGVENFLAVENPERFDFVFIEYGINDYAIYSKNKDLWRIGFSELSAVIRERCPDATICTILLGRRDPDYWEVQGEMHSEMKTISEKLGIAVIDVDSFLKSELFAATEFRGFYRDLAHYNIPVASGMIGLHCALNAIKARSGIVRRDMEANDVSASLPMSPLDRNALSDLPKPLTHLFWQNDSTQLRSFANSQLSVNALELLVGEELDFEVDGLPCGLSFVSAPDCGSILVEVDGAKSILYTMHKRVQTGEFSFLLRYAHFYWLDPDSLAQLRGRRSRVKIRVLQNDDVKTALVRKNFAMVPSEAQSPRALLCSLTYI